MHYRFLVTFTADDAKDSAGARRHVRSVLTDEGFCAQGRWSRGQADWFVIGGRWSGELSRHSWAKEITHMMIELEREHGVQVWGAFYGNPEKERIQKELAERFQQMWDAEAPPAYKGIPFQRDTYRDSGYEDDAMLLTQELYDALLKEYAGQEESDYHADLNWQSIDPDMVGKKWIVVDYHN